MDDEGRGGRPPRIALDDPPADKAPSAILKAFEKERGPDTPPAPATNGASSSSAAANPLQGKARVLAQSVVGGMKEKWLKGIASAEMAKSRALQEKLDQTQRECARQMQEQDDDISRERERHRLIVEEYEIALRALQKSKHEPLKEMPLPAPVVSDDNSDKKLKDQVQLGINRARMKVLEDTLAEREKRINELEEEVEEVQSQRNDEAEEMKKREEGAGMLQKHVDDLSCKYVALQEEAKEQAASARKVATAMKSENADLLATIKHLKDKQKVWEQRVDDASGKAPIVEVREVIIPQPTVYLVEKAAPPLASPYTPPPPPPAKVVETTHAVVPAPPPRPETRNFSQQADLQPDEPPILTDTRREVDEKKKEVTEALKQNTEPAKKPAVVRALKREEGLVEEDQILTMVTTLVKKMRTVANIQSM